MKCSAFKFARTEAPKVTRLNQSTGGNTDFPESTEDVTYVNELSKHRNVLPLYELYPFYEENYIAASATVVGEVRLDAWATVWNNSVIRGDINSIYIGVYSSIGDNTVVQTVASLPTGLPAKWYIGNNVTIHNDCSLSSCHIDNDVVIGAKSVVLEGARLEKGSMLAPGTVVPPGRLIPSNQLWAGNPAEYVKDLDIGELFANYSLSYVNSFLGDNVKNMLTNWPSNYLLKSSDKNDLDADDTYSTSNLSHPDPFLTK